MIALYFLALFSLSQSANLVRLAQAPPDIIGFWRLLGAAVLILPFALRRKVEFPPKEQRHYIWPILSAVFFFAHLWTYVYSAQHTTIAHCMIIFAINPLFVSLGAYFFLKEPLSMRSIPAYGFGLLGLYILLSQSLSGDAGSVLGDINALVSAVFFTGYLLTGKKARVTFSNIHYTFIVYLLTAIIFGINGFNSGLSFTDYPDITWFCILAVIIFPTLLGHSLFSYLMRTMNVGLMTCGKLAEPLMSVLVAYFLFREELTMWTVLSFLCTACAFVILFWPEITRQLRILAGAQKNS